MNKFLLLLLLIAPSFAIGQESILEEFDVTPEPAASVPFVDPLQERVEKLEAIVAENTATLGDVVDTLGDVAATLKDVSQSIKLLAEKPVAMPMPAESCECNCDCPTIDEIRQVVREELKAVTVTLKTANGATKQVALPLTTSKPIVSQLQPGDMVVAIDGKPVTPFAYGQSKQGTVTRYTTPAYEMRVLQSSGGFFGAVRSTNTCRMVNGVQVCN